MDTKVVIAVTRAGLGDWFIFDSFEEADEHPVVQYGDVIMCRPQDIFSQYTRLELPSLIAGLGFEDMPVERRVLEYNIDKIWSRIVERSERPPSDPSVVCDLIARDRKLTKIERKKIMTAAATDTAEKKPAASKRKYDGSDKITLLADKDGNPYGPKNNPKRAGTKSAERFAIYANGMTVEKFIADGGLYADVVHDVDKGFISVKK